MYELGLCPTLGHTLHTTLRTTLGHTLRPTLGRTFLNLSRSSALNLGTVFLFLSGSQCFSLFP